LSEESKSDPTRAGPTRRYTDPLGARAPELERCMIRHRALQMILIMYHAEELKREVISAFETRMRWRERQPPTEADQQAPAAERKKQKRAFDFLVADGVLTRDERQQMVELIGRRNGIAHHLDQVTADLTLERAVRDWVDILPGRQTHDYEALDKLRDARKLLSERLAAKHHVLTLNTSFLFFETTERVLAADIAALDRRIRKLIAARRQNIRVLNDELSLDGTHLTGFFDPRWPANRYGRGRLTPCGVEICYRLFDMRKSPLAVAHLMNISLAAARRRQRLWSEAGGPHRTPRDLEAIPRARFRRQYDD
jgi:EAL domain-containing protein (putative c-di-GMP-specific phosphodiesterase class I)